MANKWDNNMQGVLFKADKQENPNRPDYSGQGEFEGKEFWISGWKNYTKDRMPFLKLRFKIKQPVEAKKEDFNDEIPF
jgi:spore coat protein CotH